MADLVAFMRARLDEEHVAALEAEGIHPSPWRWVDPGGWIKQSLVDSRDRTVIPSAVGDVYPLAMAASHIVRWDPARVLADVAAKRAILDEIGRILPVCLDPMTPAGIVALALAQPYAEHPDFDPSWRLEVADRG